MNKENCVLKLVDEIILYYDARSKKHQISIDVIYVQTNASSGNVAFCNPMCSEVGNFVISYSVIYMQKSRRLSHNNHSYVRNHQNLAITNFKSRGNTTANTSKLVRRAHISEHNYILPSPNPNHPSPFF